MAEPDEPVQSIEGGVDLPGWEWERTVDTVEEISVGDSITFEKEISDEDVRRFAVASGDTNPLHLEEEEAAETRFGGRIAHGMLVSGLISAALARLPGIIVYLSQEMQFTGPVRIGDRARAECEIAEALGGDRYRLSTDIFVDGEPVTEGDATVLVE